MAKYPRISDDDYKKAIFQARGQMNDILQLFNMYGMGEFIPQALEEVMIVMEQFGMRVRGKDQIIKRGVK